MQSDTTEMKNNKGLILLADDEALVRETTAQILRHLGYETILCTNGKRAVETFNQLDGKCDLVMLDMVMPEMDGKETFLALRSRAPDIPIVLCSGFSVSEKAEELNSFALKAFIRKPYHVKHLEETIEGLLTDVGRINVSG